MKNTTLLCSFLLAGLLPTAATHAQDNWYPYDSSDGSYNYDSSTGLLRIPALTMRANRFEPGTLLFDVMLTHVGDETFRVISSRGLQPDDECTRAEVKAAIPQLRLNMTIAEAEALIGCKAVTSTRETDLVLGRRVEASWRGQNGVPNTGSLEYLAVNYVFSGLPSTWVSAIGGVTPSGVPVLSYSFGGSTIMFSLREGVLESYTYQYEGAAALCDADALVAGFPQLEEGDSVAEIEAKLSCVGAIAKTTISAGKISEQVLWQFLSPSIPASTPRGFDRQRIEVALVNDAMVHATKMSSDVHYSPSPCSVDEIVSIAGAIQIGMSEDAMLALSTCPSYSVTSTETNTSRTTDYRWNTQNVAESVYVSANRSLSVLVHDGKVSVVNLRRH